MCRLPVAALTLAALLALSAAGCTGGNTPTATPSSAGSDTPAPTRTPGTIPSSIQDGALEDLDIAPGSTVQWRNQDTQPHTIDTITSTGEPVESGEIAPGEAFEHTFTHPGVWDLVVDDGTQTWVVTVR